MSLGLLAAGVLCCLPAAAQTLTVPAPYSFGSQTVGVAQSATLTFSATAATTLTYPQVLTQGASNLDFLANGGTCTGSIAAGSSCTYVVKFTPTRPGLRVGTFQVTANGVVQTVPLSGTGTGPVVAFPANQVPVNWGSPAFSSGMVFDSLGDLFLVDSSAGAVKRIGSNGAYSIYTGSSGAVLVSGFSGPFGMAIDGAGNLYVADRQNKAIKEVVAVNGFVANPVVRTLGSGFSNPYAVAVDTKGNVYVADTGNGSVKEIVAVNGTIPATNPTIQTLASGYSRLQGILVDAAGDVFFTDFGDGINTPTSLNEIVAGGGGTVQLANGSTGMMQNPWSLAQDAGGNIYVANGNTITEYLAQNGSVQPGGPIYVLATGLNAAEGLAIDPLGNVFYTTGSVLYRIGVSAPATLAFNTTAVGATSSDSPKTVVVQNTGNATLTFPLPASGSTNPNVPVGFTLGSSSTCPFLTQNSYGMGTLAANSSCTESVSFQPPSAASYNSQLSFTDVTAQKTTVTQNATVTGQGTASTGTTAQTITFTLPALVQAGANYTLNGTSTSGLPILYRVTSGSAIISGNTLIVYGSATGFVTVSASQNGNSTYAAATAVSRSATVEPEVAVGSSATYQVTLTITTAGTLGKVNFLSLGQPNLDYTANTSSCYVNTAYAVNATCAVYINFLPKSPGLRRGAVQLVDTTGTKVMGTLMLSNIANGPLAGFTIPGLPSSLYTAAAHVGTGIVTDGAGNLFYVDDQIGQLHELTTTGTDTLIASFNHPEGLGIDGAGNLFVAESQNGSVWEVMAVSGKIPASPTVRQLTTTPYGYAVAVDRFGSVFYSDFRNGTISELQAVNGVIPNGATPVVIGSNLGSVWSLAFDNAGNLYFSEYYGTHYFTQVNGMVSPGAAVVTVPNLGGAYQGMVFDAAGDLYVSDTVYNGVYQVRAVSGGLPSNPVIVSLGGATRPTGLTLDNAGTLYAGSCDDQQYTGYCGDVIRYVQNMPQNVAFANADVGSNSPDSPVAVPLSNLGNTTLSMSALAVTAPFALDSATTTCSATATVAPGSQCNLGVDFAPVAGGSATGTLTFTNNSLNVTTSKQVSQLSGTGIALSVQGLGPSAGPATGGNTVTVYGTVLKGTTSVKFGTRSATNVTVVDDNTVTVTAPTGTAGTTVDVVVTTTNGSSPVTSADQYTYQLSATLTLSVPNAHTGNADFQIAASSNSPGNINYSIVSGPATVNGNTISLNPGGAGRVVVEADQDASGFYAPATVQTSFTVENGTGSLWIVNGDGSVSEYDLNGNLLSPPAGSAGAAVGTVPSPQGAAFDSNGDLWLVGANGVNYYTPNGTPGFTTPLTVAGISNPKSVIVDGTGHVWILNGNNSVSLVSGTGSPISPATGYTGGGISSPSALTIDNSGNLWITNGNNTLTEILGGAGPIAPLALGVQNGTTGARP